MIECMSAGAVKARNNATIDVDAHARLTTPAVKPWGFWDTSTFYERSSDDGVGRTRRALKV